MRIRSRLLLLVCAVLVPALLGAGIGLAYVYEEERKFLQASMQETARAMALALDRDMARREAVLRTLSASSSLARGELRHFYEYMREVGRETGSAIILSDLEGRQILNTRIPFGAALPRMLAEEREMRRRFGNEVTLVSDLYVPPPGLGSRSFAVQVPVRYEGKVAQFLTMGSFAEQMQVLLARQNLPEGWHATIVDRRGVVVARSLEPEKFVGRPVRASLAEMLQVANEGFREGASLAGVPSTVFFSRAPQSGWAFLVTVPREHLYGPADRTVGLMAGITLLLLAIGGAAALIVAHRISRPVEALRDAARRLGENAPVAAERFGTVELDDVSRVMATASERLRGATAELERRVAEAVSIYERSQRALVQAQKLEALGRLTGGIAHDFNNVLQTLASSLQLLRHAPHEEQAEVIARCQRAVVRGSELARQLMAFGRMQELRVKTVDTAARLAECRRLLDGALPANIALEYRLSESVWPVSVDPAQLELALLNLVLNARDAMPAGGKVRLEAENATLPAAQAEIGPGDYVRLVVSDTGEGMSEEVMARALEPFYTTKAVGKGSGMGLPQAYGFARQNGGTLVLASRPGQGTTVTLYLPRATEPVAPRAPRGPDAALPAGRGGVLLVEDDSEVRETVSQSLRAAGFDVATATSADEALARLDDGERFDAVFTDIVMPGKRSGIDLAEEIRRRAPRIGVVLATGYTERTVRVPGVRLLAKPYEMREAVEALNAAIGAERRAR